MELRSTEPSDGQLDLIKLALTISPATTFKTAYELRTLLNRWRRCFRKLKSQFWLHPEIADGNRLHFHGVYFLGDRISFEEDKSFLEQYGFIKIKPITDLKKWKTYCYKEWRVTRKSYFHDYDEKKLPKGNTKKDFLTITYWGYMCDFISHDLAKYGIKYI
jgi:hypothetical protein